MEIKQKDDVWVEIELVDSQDNFNNPLRFLLDYNIIPDMT